MRYFLAFPYGRLSVTASVLAAMFVLAVAGPQAHAQEKTPSADETIENPDATVYVDGLACPFCAYGLEKKLDDHDAVRKLQVEIEGGRVLLAFRDGQALTKDEIKQAVEKAGFTARKIEFSDDAPSDASSI